LSATDGSGNIYLHGTFLDEENRSIEEFIFAGEYHLAWSVPLFLDERDGLFEDFLTEIIGEYAALSENDLVGFEKELHFEGVRKLIYHFFLIFLVS